MKLAEWIALKRMSRTAVAEALGVSPAYVTNLCSDDPNWPGRDVALRLQSLTDGAVTAADFLHGKPTPAAPEQTGRAA